MKNAKIIKGCGEKAVRALWDCFYRLRWDDAEQLLAKNFVALWPQSAEKIQGARNFIELNRNYPGKHRITVKNITTIGDKVISEVFIKSVMPGGKRLTLFAVSFFTIQNGKIASAKEYWADTCPAPAWRKQWVKKM